MLLAHGFGCDQNMWRHFRPAFENDFRVVAFDHVGSGNSDLTQYDRKKYNSLHGYAGDVLEIIDALGQQPVTFVGHSVSSMIGVLAAIRRPESFENLILIGPSPCYLNDGDYRGGFDRADIDAMLDTLDSNYLGWSSTMAPVVMANADRPHLTRELEQSFCRTRPDIARQFAEVTFLSDNRKDLAHVETPTLILQCSADAIAPDSVGEFTHRSIRNSVLVQLKATGHCPHLSEPAETIAAVREFLNAG